MKKTLRAFAVLSATILTILAGCATMGTISQEEWVDSLLKAQEKIDARGIGL